MELTKISNNKHRKLTQTRYKFTGNTKIITKISHRNKLELTRPDLDLTEKAKN